MTDVRNILIARAAIADIDELAPLFQSYRVFYEQAPNAQVEMAFLRERLERQDSVLFIARENNEPAGFAQLFPTFSSVHLGGAFILEDLFVKPQSRGRGIAHALLERARQYAIDQNAVGMFLETAHTNTLAQRLYAAAGWALETTFRKYNCPMERVSQG